MASRPEADSSNGLSEVSMAAAREIIRSLTKLSTGSDTLDSLLGGGLEEARITEVFGASNSGKTQLAIQATVMAAARGWRSVYVDTEATFRPERLEQIARAREIDAATALGSVYAVRAQDVEAQTRALGRMAGDERVASAKLVVVDTVTKNFTLEFPGREKTGRRQGALGAYLNRMALDAYLHRRVVLLTNRVASVPDDGASREVDVGGLTLRKFVRKSLRLRREGGKVMANLEMPTTSPPAACRISERGVE